MYSGRLSIALLSLAALISATGCRTPQSTTIGAPTALSMTPNAISSQPRTAASIDPVGVPQRLSSRDVNPLPLAETFVRRLPPVGADPRGHQEHAVQLVAHSEASADDRSEQANAEASPEELAEEVHHQDSRAEPLNDHPIDLANALALGGASNLQIQLARERVIESQAMLLQAQATWLPSLRFGLGYNRHDGQLQATPGDVIQAGRNSLFVGGGAGLGAAPLPGGAGGPPRLFVNLSLADAIFLPLVARRQLAAESAAELATINDTHLEIAVAYFDLVEAHGLMANADSGLEAAIEMAELARLFAREGKLSESEVDRANTESAFWKQSVQEAERLTIQRSAELVRLLRLDPYQTLVPAEEKVAPVTFVDEGVPREALIAQGLTSRPELAQYQSLVAAALRQLRQEQWRPWVPHFQVGASGGSFGGGQSDIFDNQAGRGDLDLLAVWEWRNLGIGNHGLQRERASQMCQARLQAEAVRDRVVAQVVTAANDTTSYQSQMRTAEEGVSEAEQSYRRNLQRIREGEGLPIELIQSIRARGNAQDAYTGAISSYNRAQFLLLRALGRPLGEMAPMENPMEDAADDAADDAAADHTKLMAGS